MEQKLNSGRKLMTDQKRRFWLAGCLLLSFQATELAEPAQEFERFLWKKRLVLVFAPALQDERFLRQRAALESKPDELAERDVLVFSVTDDVKDLKGTAGKVPTSRLLRKMYSVEAADFATILVGKDGKAKLRSEKPILWELIQREIDAMPMRRDEARGRR